MRMNRYFFRGFALAALLGALLLPGQTAAPAPRVYATLQKAGAPRGYVGGSLKTGLEETAGFFVVTGETVRLANADYKIVENADSPKENKTYSLQDAKGRFLICCDNGAVTMSAAPADNTQWFRIRFYTPAQKTEIENRVRAMQDRKAHPGVEAEVN
jgi:hypothetical protein